MNKYRFLYLAAGMTMALASCTQKSPTAFTINGTIDAADGEQIVLNYGDENNVISDTATITAGKFQFKGTLPVPATQALLYQGDLRNYRMRTYCHLWITPGVITAAIDTANWLKPTVTGSVPQAESEEMDALSSDLHEQITALNEQKHAAHAAGDQDAYMALDEQMDVLYEESRNRSYDYIMAHPASYPAAQYMRFMTGSIPFDKLKAAYDNFTPEVKASGILDDVKKEIDVLESLLPGNPAPDMASTDIFTGDSIRLSDLRGHVVLIDFWASWCVPCRASMPHVIACWEKYKDKGFEVFCVADNDSNPDEARKASQEDGSNMFHHVLRGFHMEYTADGGYIMDRSHDLSDKYAVHSIPTKYLIDADGNIIGKMETDEQLDAALRQAYGE